MTKPNTFTPHDERSLGRRRDVLGLMATLMGLGLALSGCVGSVPQQAAATPTHTPTPTETRTELELAAANCMSDQRLGVELMDEGKSIDMRTPGEDPAYRFGPEWDKVECVLKKVGASSAILARMKHTRALDGTLTRSWRGYEASWTYHPDKGLNVILESKE